MATDTLRTLTLAYKHCSSEHIDQEDVDEHGVYNVERTGFTLLLVVGIKDVPRSTVKQSVLTCQKAGIKVRMVTGDNEITAEAIAKECNIIMDHMNPGYK